MMEKRDGARRTRLDAGSGWSSGQERFAHPPRLGRSGCREPTALWTIPVACVDTKKRPRS